MGLNQTFREQAWIWPTHLVLDVSIWAWEWNDVSSPPNHHFCHFNRVGLPDQLWGQRNLDLCLNFIPDTSLKSFSSVGTRSGFWEMFPAVNARRHAYIGAHLVYGGARAACERPVITRTVLPSPLCLPLVRQSKFLWVLMVFQPKARIPGNHAMNSNPMLCTPPLAWEVLLGMPLPTRPEDLWNWNSGTLFLHSRKKIKHPNLLPNVPPCQKKQEGPWKVFWSWRLKTPWK